MIFIVSCLEAVLIIWHSPGGPQHSTHCWLPWKCIHYEWCNSANFLGKRANRYETKDIFLCLYVCIPGGAGNIWRLGRGFFVSVCLCSGNECFNHTQDIPAILLHFTHWHCCSVYQISEWHNCSMSRQTVTLLFSACHITEWLLLGVVLRRVALLLGAVVTPLYDSVELDCTSTVDEDKWSIRCLCVVLKELVCGFRNQYLIMWLTPQEHSLTDF